MKTTRELFANIKLEKPTTTKDEEWWQLAGKEMTKFFGRNCYWIFWKYPRIKIDRAWHLATKDNDKDWTHFLHNLK